MLLGQKAAPGMYVAHLCNRKPTTFQSVSECNPELHAADLPKEVFAFYYFTVEVEGGIFDDQLTMRPKGNKQYYVDARLIMPDDAENIAGVSRFKVETARDTKEPVMCYDNGQRYRRYDGNWMDLVFRAR